MSEFTLDDYRTQFSDMYKDAYGSRPRTIDTSTWTVAQFERQFECMQEIIIESEQQRASDEREMAVLLERRIASSTQPREVFIANLHLNLGTDGDADFLCYKLGVRYGYFD